MKGSRRSDDAVTATSTGALAVLPGWAFSGPFAWAAGSGLDAATPDDDLQPQDLDDQSVPDSLPYLTSTPVPEPASDQLTIAAEVLWQQLRRSRFQWQRSVAFDSRVLSFYSAPARVAVEIVDDAAATGSGRPNLSSPADSGIRMVPIPLADIEQRCGTVVGWLDTVCVGRSLAGVSAANSVIPGAATRWRRRRPN